MLMPLGKEGLLRLSVEQLRERIDELDALQPGTTVPWPGYAQARTAAEIALHFKEFRFSADAPKDALALDLDYAINASHTRLRSLSINDLEAHIQRLSEAMRHDYRDATLKQDIEKALALAKEVLENKRLRILMLESTDREQLAKLYFSMDKQQLVEAYKYHAVATDDLLCRYIDAVMDVKARTHVSRDKGAGHGKEYQVLDKKMTEAKLPTVTAVMESIRRGMIETVKGMEPESLREMMEDYEEKKNGREKWLRRLKRVTMACNKRTVLKGSWALLGLLLVLGDICAHC